MQDVLTIKVRYLSDKIQPLEYIDGKSDWVDLRAAEDVELKAGEFKLIPLGIAMQLPKGYEAIVSNGVQPASSRNMPFGVRLLSPSSSTSRFDPLPLMTSNFFGWTMLHKMIPSFLWRNICPSRTLSCCMAGGNSTIKRP